MYRLLITIKKFKLKLQSAFATERAIPLNSVRDIHSNKIIIQKLRGCTPEKAQPNTSSTFFSSMPSNCSLGRLPSNTREKSATLNLRDKKIVKKVLDTNSKNIS